MNTLMHPVQSTNIQEIGYIEKTKTLIIRFQGGSLYAYAGVEQEKYEALNKAESIGKYIGTFIKGVNTYKHITDEDSFWKDINNSIENVQSSNTMKIVLEYLQKDGQKLLKSEISIFGGSVDIVTDAYAVLFRKDYDVGQEKFPTDSLTVKVVRKEELEELDRLFYIDEIKDKVPIIRKRKLNG